MTSYLHAGFDLTDSVRVMHHAHGEPQYPALDRVQDVERELGRLIRRCASRGGQRSSSRMTTLRPMQDAVRIHEKLHPMARLSPAD